MATKSVTIEVIGCARCGEEHEDLEFLPLSSPIVVIETFQLTHFALCPNTGEPILLKLEEQAKKTRRRNVVKQG